jgi:hypothetical protein
VVLQGLVAEPDDGCFLAYAHSRSRPSVKARRPACCGPWHAPEHRTRSDRGRGAAAACNVVCIWCKTAVAARQPGLR